MVGPRPEAAPLLDGDPATEWCVGPEGGELELNLAEPLVLREARLTLGSGKHYPTHHDWHTKLASNAGRGDLQSDCAPAWGCGSFIFSGDRPATRLKISIRQGPRWSTTEQVPRFCARDLVLAGTATSGEARLVGAGVPPASAARLESDLKQLRAVFDACDAARMADVALFPFHLRCAGNCRDGLEQTDDVVTGPEPLAKTCQAGERLGEPSEWSALLGEVRVGRYLGRINLRGPGSIAMTVNPTDTSGYGLLLAWREGRWRIAARESWGD